MPHNCRKCGGKGHSMKTCKEDACRVCRVTGHSSKDCPKKKTITAPGPERFEVKCSLYMDDVTVFCADRRSVDTLVQTCETFGRASGAKVNCGKSEAMLFGDWQPASSAPFPFSIQPELQGGEELLVP
ncbi:uncharacterized protein ACNLHF_004831 [Anomaloglossus baeobatrachus]